MKKYCFIELDQTLTFTLNSHFIHIEQMKNWTLCAIVGIGIVIIGLGLGLGLGIGLGIGKDDEDKTTIC